MAAQIFVNLPVKNLNRSVEFFTKLGFTFDPKFTDENATCMIVGENILSCCWLRVFSRLSPLEALVCISADSRERINEMVSKAVAAGGTTPNQSKDYGFMYQHGFQDPDGHLWELIYMDPGATSKINYKVGDLTKE